MTCFIEYWGFASAILSLDFVQHQPPLAQSSLRVFKEVVQQDLVFVGA